MRCFLPSSHAARRLTVPARCRLMRCTYVTPERNTGMGPQMSPEPCTLAHLHTFKRFPEIGHMLSVLLLMVVYAHLLVSMHLCVHLVCMYERVRLVSLCPMTQV